MGLYPLELFGEPLRSGYGVTQKSNVISSEIDIGEAKKRRRYTAPIYNETWSLILGTPGDFISWFEVNLQSGVQRFTYSDPFLGVNKECRIVGMPTYKPYGKCGSYTATFSVELLP